MSEPETSRGDSSAARTSGLRRQHRGRSPIVPIPAGTLVAGKYRIESLLGDGGMGAVYKAEHVIMKRPIALKVMRPEMASDPSMSARFTREAQAASRIASPHVVTIHDFGQAEDGLLYLVMELLQGEALSARLESRVLLPWQEAIAIAIQICEALTVAHAADVVHRDLKPDNVFLCSDGTCKVLDFGIARIIARDESGIDARRITHAGSIIGTPLYISPEAAAHRPVGPHADLYALGAMLFEMVTGRLVFEDEHVILLLGAHLTRAPERVRVVRPELDLPATLDAVIDRLLAKDPAARHSDAAELATELGAILAAHGGTPALPYPRAPGAVTGRRVAPSIASTLPAGQRTLVTPDPSHASAATEPGEPAEPERKTPERPDGAAANGTTTDRAPANSGATDRAAANSAATSSAERVSATPASTQSVSELVIAPVQAPASWRVPVIAASAIAVLVIAIVIGSSGEDTPTPAVAAPPLTSQALAPVASLPVAIDEPSEPAPPPVVAPATVELHLVTTPTDARITIDGAPIEGARAELPRDGAAHVVIVSADSYVARTLTVTADRDREIVLDLDRAPTTRSRAPSKTRTTTSETVTAPPEGTRPASRGHIVGEF